MLTPGVSARFGTQGETMIKHGIRLASATALALTAAIMAGPASVARPAAAGPARVTASAPVAWVVSQSVPSATKGLVTPFNTATNKVIRKIPVSRNAIAVTLAPDGRTAWVALNAVRPCGEGELAPMTTGTDHVSNT